MTEQHNVNPNARIYQLEDGTVVYGRGKFPESAVIMMENIANSLQAGTLCLARLKKKATGEDAYYVCLDARASATAGTLPEEDGLPPLIPIAELISPHDAPFEHVEVPDGGRPETLRVFVGTEKLTTLEYPADDSEDEADFAKDMVRHTALYRQHQMVAAVNSAAKLADLMDVPTSGEAIAIGTGKNLEEGARRLMEKHGGNAENALNHLIEEVFPPEFLKDLGIDHTAAKHAPILGLDRDGNPIDPTSIPDEGPDVFNGGIITRNVPRALLERLDPGDVTGVLKAIGFDPADISRFVDVAAAFKTNQVSMLSVRRKDTNEDVRVLVRTYPDDTVKPLVEIISNASERYEAPPEDAPGLSLVEVSPRTMKAAKDAAGGIPEEFFRAPGTDTVN